MEDNWGFQARRLRERGEMPECSQCGEPREHLYEFGALSLCSQCHDAAEEARYQAELAAWERAEDAAIAEFALGAEQFSEAVRKDAGRQQGELNFKGEVA